MEIDKEKIKQRFSEINEAVSGAKDLATLSDKEFWSRKENIVAIKYYLLQAIEAVGGVCVHIAAKKFNKGVSAFGECFEVMEKEGALEKSLADKLRKMAKFRNKLIIFSHISHYTTKKYFKDLTNDIVRVYFL